MTASDEQRLEIIRLLGDGYGSEQIAKKLDLSVHTVRAIKAHVTMGTYRTSTQDEKVEDALETTFGLESDLQKALRSNIDQLEPGLTITDGGKESTVQSGRIDIRAQDRTNNSVVIELKVGEADREAVAQILSYIGDLSEACSKVRGILVAGAFTPRAISAARAVQNLQLFKYSFKFAFEGVRPSSLQR